VHERTTSLPEFASPGGPDAGASPLQELPQQGIAPSKRILNRVADARMLADTRSRQVPVNVAKVTAVLLLLLAITSCSDPTETDPQPASIVVVSASNLGDLFDLRLENRGGPGVFKVRFLATAPCSELCPSGEPRVFQESAVLM
jgi:hypothetical protein